MLLDHHLPISPAVLHLPTILFLVHIQGIQKRTALIFLCLTYFTYSTTFTFIQVLRITGFPGLGRLNAITLGIHVVFYFLSLHIVKVYGIMLIHIMKYLHQQIAISINRPLSEIAPNYLFFSCIFSHWWHSANYCPPGVHCNGSLCWLFSTTATLCHLSSAFLFPVSLFPGTLCFYACFYVSSFITFSLSTVLLSTVLFFSHKTLGISYLDLEISDTLTHYYRTFLWDISEVCISQKNVLNFCTGS